MTAVLYGSADATDSFRKPVGAGLLLWSQANREVKQLICQFQGRTALRSVVQPGLRDSVRLGFAERLLLSLFLDIQLCRIADGLEAQRRT